MKKLLSMLIVASMFGLLACGSSEEENAAQEADAQAKVEELFESLDEEAEEAELAENKSEKVECDSTKCAESCKAKKEEKSHTESDEHVHVDGEEHSH